MLDPTCLLLLGREENGREHPGDPANERQQKGEQHRAAALVDDGEGREEDAD